MAEYPKEVQARDTDSLVGNFVVLWRGDGKDARKVLAVVRSAWEEDGEVRVGYTLQSGLEVGKDFNARYDPNQKVIVYDEGSKILAGLEC